MGREETALVLHVATAFFIVLALVGFWIAAVTREGKLDPTKRARLLEVKYVIRPACGICQHGQLIAGASWGTCKQQEPTVVISRYGSCQNFALGTYAAQDLHDHSEFLREKSTT